ncbi:hypothetical protein DFH07DRAFT_928832 [Mycena maculata]|uniref:NAD(P)-binding protein n=1 Tax=Mycena maculata TaxID=230809 RepID=A0AAD7I2C1_9AGAR|nr:hypothetical protein DFH07DRAFT_928832 [Mycena maculata]
MRFSFWSFVKQQWERQPPVFKADLTGKTVLVLGANTGIGFEATKHFATMNPGRLILACRSQSKGQAALEKLEADTGYAKAELWIIDLANFESVQQFADKFKRDGGWLDIFVANAAIGTSKYEPTENGWESSLQVNHLSITLLALLLLPSMIKTSREHATLPRLVVVSSGAHYWIEIEKPVVENPEIVKTVGSAEYCTSGTAMRNRYVLTKLFNVFFVRALNARLPSSTPLIVNTVSPGYCYSELRRNFSGILAVVDFLMERALAFSAEVGSRRLVWAALAQQDHPEKLRGQYISNFDIKEVSDFVLSPQGAKAEDLVWEDTLDILNKVDPRVNEIVAKYLTATA